MAQHNDLGILGEEKAKEFLLANGFRILHQNWRFGKEEIDIIAEKEDHLAIVEVKSRKSGHFGSPQEFVGLAKRRHLIRAADAFAHRYKIEKDIHFHIIAITFEPKLQLNFIPEAFYP